MDKSSRLLSSGLNLVLLTGGLGWSGPARADPPHDYAAKFTCDIRAHKVVVAIDGSAPKQPSDFGKFESEVNLNALQGKAKVLCHLQPGFVVSVTPELGFEHPREDGAAIEVNGHVVNRVYFNLYESTTTIRSLSGTAVGVTACEWHPSSQGLTSDPCEEVVIPKGALSRSFRGREPIPTPSGSGLVRGRHQMHGFDANP